MSEIIRAKFYRTIFSSEDRAFCVAMYQNVETHEYFTAVGADLPYQEKVKYDLEGNWQKRKGAMQLAVDTWTIPKLADANGFIAYVSTLKCGIGAKRAKKIFECFGEQVWDICTNTPERLLEVKGINRKMVDTFHQRLKETEAQQKIISLFSKSGVRVSPKCVAQFCEKYKPEGFQVFQRNPYYMIYACDGVSFDTVDPVALNLGFNKNHPERLRAYSYKVIIDYSAKTGSVCMPCEEAVSTICNAISVSRHDVISILKEEWAAGKIIASKGMFYLQHSYDTECSIARQLAAFEKQCLDPHYQEFNPERIMDEYEDEFNIRLADEQRDAVAAMFKHSVTVVTGGPGTGKSTVIKAILYAHKKVFGEQSQPILLAPTGKAAKRMSEVTGYPASTIHSAVGYRGEDLECADVMLDGNLIIVDESSMVDQEICSVLLNSIQPGAQIMLVGDVDQLPSVGAGNVLSDIIRSGSITVTRLTTIFRQAEDNPIITNCQKVNNGSADLVYSNTFKFYDTQGDAEALFNSVIKFYVKCVEAYGIDDVCLLNPRRQNTRISVNTLNAAIQEKVNPSTGGNEMKVGNSVFRVHDKVMQTKNNDSIKNGDIGYIKDITYEMIDGENTPVATIDFGGDVMIVKYDKEQFMSNGIELAYCSTVHKSQGTEYKTVIIVLTKDHSSLLRRKIVYTAISRAKKNVAIFGEPAALNYAVGNTKETPRITLLAERLAFYSQNNKI